MCVVKKFYGEVTKMARHYISAAAAVLATAFVSLIFSYLLGQSTEFPYLPSFSLLNQVRKVCITKHLSIFITKRYLKARIYLLNNKQIHFLLPLYIPDLDIPN